MDNQNNKNNCIKCAKEIPEGAPFCPWCGKKQISDRKHKKRPNGAGSIGKLSGNRAKPWQARKAGVMIGTFATRGEAQKALERLTDTDVTERYNLTFTEVYDRWLPEHSRDIGTTAIGNYQTAYGHCGQLYDRKFRSLRASDFQRIIIEMEQKGLSKSSCEKARQLFGQMSSWAIREGIMTVNYSRHITITAKQQTVGLVFSQKDMERISVCTHYAAPIVRILLATGCRGIDLFTAELKNCHDNYFVSGSKSEAGRDRVIAVAPYGLKDYRDLVEAAKASGGDLLISGYPKNKIYPNWAKRDFPKMMQTLAIEGFTPYDCKHTFITTAVRKGMDKQLLKIMVGHADLNTTDKYYTHMEKADILKAISALEL